MPILEFILGIVLGSGAAWFILRSKIDHARESALSQSNLELAKLQERLQGKEQRISELENKLSQVNATIQQLEGDIKIEINKRSSTRLTAC